MAELKAQRTHTPYVIENTNEVRFVYIDLFCGAGGTTTGLVDAKVNGKNIALVAACVNHDPGAIKSHWLNHPEVVHFEEDIRTLQLSPLRKLINDYRKIYKNAKIVLWASLECTNFSKAKGGQPRDADSRTLANHLFRYITALNPDYIQIENVVEFMAWGPMRIMRLKHHKENLSKGIYANSELKMLQDKKTGVWGYAYTPLSKKNGQYFMEWKERINSFGYRDEWNQLNSADFGAYTSRNRLFGCFAKEGLPIVWPEATHSKKPQGGDLFGGGLKKWMPVKHVLDFEDEGISIFKRKKPLSPKTLERIYAGLVKYVAGGKDAFIAQYNSGSDNSRVIDLEKPCNVIPTNNRYSLVQTSFLAKYYSGRPEGKVTSVNDPAGTITTVGNQALVNASFLAKYYGNGDNISSIEDPSGTLTTKDRIAKIQACWLDKQYSGKHNHQSVDVPAGTIMTSDKHSLVKVEPFIMNTSFGNVGKSIDEPAPTLLASRRHHYIINPSHGGHVMGVDVPCPVIIARQDKSPLYLAQAISGWLNIDIEKFLSEKDIEMLYEMNYVINAKQYAETDKSVHLRIIEFMLMYGLSDIKMRMLKIIELILIQGFPEDYQLFGNQTDQKKFIGNSVVPQVVTAWVEAMAQPRNKFRYN